jgi:hypothetical protein
LASSASPLMVSARTLIVISFIVIGLNAEGLELSRASQVHGSPRGRACPEMPRAGKGP